MSLATKFAGAISPAKTEEAEKRAAAVDGVRRAEKRASEAQQAVARQQAAIDEAKAKQRQGVENGVSDDVFAILDEELVNAERRMRRVQIEAESAGRQLEEARRAQILIANEASRKAMERLTVKFKAAAAAITDDIASFKGHWDQLFDVAERIRTAWPGGIAPYGCLVNIGEITGAVSMELYKQGANPFVGGGQPVRGAPTIVGAKCTDHRLMGEPQKIPSLKQAVDEAMGMLLKQLDPG